MASPDRVTNLVGALVLVASDAVRSATDQAAGHTDAAPATLASLLAAPKGRSIDEIRRMVGLTPSGGVRLVDRLVADGLAERRTGVDRRAVIVVLTPQGHKAARRVLTARAAAIERILQPLTAEERAALEQVAEKLVAAHAVDRLTARDQGVVPPGGWTCRLCDQIACGRDHGTCPAANAVGATRPGPQEAVTSTDHADQDVRRRRGRRPT